MINKYDYVVNWIKENPYGFTVICDTNPFITFKTTYRRVARKVRAPFKALQNGHIRYREGSGSTYSHVSAAVIDPNILYYHPADKFLLLVNKGVEEKFAEVIEHTRSLGKSVEVVHIDD